MSQLDSGAMFAPVFSARNDFYVSGLFANEASNGKRKNSSENSRGKKRLRSATGSTQIGSYLDRAAHGIKVWLYDVCGLDNSDRVNGARCKRRGTCGSIPDDCRISRMRCLC